MAEFGVDALFGEASFGSSDVVAPERPPRVLSYPSVTSYSDTELRWIESEPSGLLPTDQDSFWGQQRKVFCDYMQTEMFDKLEAYYANMSPLTCDEDDIANWEIMLGIPVDTAKSLAYRRAFVQIRRYRGAFTRTFRKQVVELFINAANGIPILFFTPGGLPFSDSVPLLFGSGTFDTSTAYAIVEDIPNFTYAVKIRDDVGVDEVGLRRELKRITPAPIDDNFTIERFPDPLLVEGDTPLTISGGAITDVTRTTGDVGDADTEPGGIGVWEDTTNLLDNGSFETDTTGWEST